MRIPHFPRVSVFLGLFLAALVLAGCATTPNYLFVDGPRYAGAYAQSAPQNDEGFQVVTWNIQYSRHVDAAIHLLKTAPELQNLDVLLLQEMDEEGVDRMARALHLNYVYYPASIHIRHKHDFGEAILSPWPLIDDGKLILPHYSPRNGQIRIAVRAWVQTPDQPVLVYNTHTETSLMTPAQRLDQVRALLADVDADASPVIIGGDFNTITPWEQRVLVENMGEAGFAWVTVEAGPTVTEMGAGVTMDYIFARGMDLAAAGVIPDAEVSDHLPLWVELR